METVARGSAKPERGTIPFAQHSIPLASKAPHPAAHKHRWDALLADLAGSQYISRLDGVVGDAAYPVNIIIGNQSFNGVVDTGR